MPGNGLFQSLPGLPSVQVADALRSGMAGGLELVAGSGHLGGYVLGDEERFIFFVQFHADTLATF